uniref:Uncharacterized protein n=1 Tax=Panagrolaimus davidi TaxID=227884 RepID=A0A914QEH7_9BILA
MNELIAILLCVFVCCGMFLLWLVSMATCPDRMVNLISGGGESKTSSSSSRNESCELVSSKDEDSGEASESPEKDIEGGINFSKPASARRTDSKKLSVVPEQDEQVRNF